MQAILYENVEKTIKGKPIIHDISFSVEEGEIFGLLGPNGAGKTTLMKMTVGLSSYDDGAIFVFGKSVKTDLREILPQIGILIENPALYPYMSGYDNLLVMAKSLGIPKSAIEPVVELVGLQQAIGAKTKTYSLGMKQRLGIALALLRNPRIMILDEPTNGLDPQGIMELRMYLKKIARERGITILVSSHLLPEMSMLCDRFAMIKKGEIKKVVSKEESEQLQGSGQIQFEVSDGAAAKQILQPQYAVEAQGERVLIRLERQQIPVVNEKLVKNGIFVYGITPQGNSLENYYFHIMQEEENVSKIATT